jgi:hypothetical protein
LPEIHLISASPQNRFAPIAADRHEEAYFFNEMPLIDAGCHYWLHA